MRLFSRFKPPAPEPVPTDTVVPVPLLDDQPRWHQRCVHYGYLFNDVLDSDKLRHALQRLMEIGEWRKLGARIRMNVNHHPSIEIPVKRILTDIQSHGKLEYHIPAHFDAARPGFVLTSDKQPMSISEHPLASKLPTSSGRPFLSSHLDISSLSLHPDCPRKLVDWLFSDWPLLVIHVVNFHDATLLSLTYLHVVMDAMGIKHLFQAWSSVVNGREEYVPRFRGIDEDLGGTDSAIMSAREFIQFPKWLRGFRWIIFRFRTFWEMFRYGQQETRQLCIPGHIINIMRGQMMRKLEQTSHQHAESVFLSESDVLLAWWTRTMLKGLGETGRRPIALYNLFDARANLPRTSASGEDAFISNVILHATTSLRAREMVYRPLSFLAWHIRSALIQHRTRHQSLAQLATQKVALDTTGATALWGEPTSLIIFCTNWHRCQLYEIDFSSAVIPSASPATGRRNTIGRPLQHITAAMPKSLHTRNFGIIFGKDGAGDWWLAWTLRAQAWPTIQKELERLDNLDKLGQLDQLQEDKRSHPNQGRNA